jgi:hypothetical protein
MKHSDDVFTEEAMTQPLFEELMSEKLAREDGWLGPHGFALWRDDAGQQ